MTHPPLLPGFYPDPSICRTDAGYFLATSSFEYFPGVPLFHSTNLTGWRQVGHILDRPSQLDLTGAWISGGIYASTLRYHDGLYYLVTTVVGCERSGNFLVTAADPFGDWSDPVWIPEAIGIDPDLFWDADGTCYLQWSRKESGNSYIRIGQARLNSETGKLLEPPRDIWKGSGGLGPEGPHIYLIEGTYYLCIAEGGTEFGHMQTIARSDSPTGPFESCPRNPILTHRSLHTDVHAVGHADIVQTPAGDWYGVAHGIRTKGYHRFHVLGRETYLYPVSWADDGWPVFGEQGTLPSEAFPIEGKVVEGVKTDFNDTFSTSEYPLDWNWHRNPKPENYRRQADGALMLKGSKDRIDGGGQATWIGVRQRLHRCGLQADLKIEAGYETGAEAGLVVWQNLRHHFILGIRKTDTGLSLFSRVQLEDLVVEEPIDLNPITISRWEIQAEDLRYRLGVRLKEKEDFVELASIQAKWLSTEVSGRFTGVYFALFAQGNIQLQCRSFTIQADQINMAPGYSTRKR
ncbi:MAG: family 43 glycosylhydrolase [Verrucomicrobia bacterium]|jgi:alpha-N-arabinofuranosidase|nr:family 43 glycosylhydrolase [Verrucomicrobiota bacterium]